MCPSSDNQQPSRWLDKTRQGIQAGADKETEAHCSALPSAPSCKNTRLLTEAWRSSSKVSAQRVVHVWHQFLFYFFCFFDNVQYTKIEHTKNSQCLKGSIQSKSWIRRPGEWREGGGGGEGGRGLIYLFLFTALSILGIGSHVTVVGHHLDCIDRW